jgi:ketosteroid isomerase-like protein
MGGIMARASIGCGLIVVCAVSAVAAQAGKTEAEIAALDKRWGEAYVACDTKAWEALLADDLVFVHNNGAIDDKAKQMASIAACAIESLNARTLKIRLYGADTAIVLGAMTGKAKGRNFTFDLLYTRVYVRQNGAWRLVTHQSTDAPRKTSQ